MGSAAALNEPSRGQPVARTSAPLRMTHRFKDTPAGSNACLRLLRDLGCSRFAGMNLLQRATAWGVAVIGALALGGCGSTTAPAEPPSPMLDPMMPRVVMISGAQGSATPSAAVAQP